MLASAFLLLLNGAFLSLRLGAGSGSFPRPLPAKEERRCVERWMQGDLEARNTLIEHNLRLVAHIIKKYYTSESEQDDLISIGTVGLIKGVSTYRPDKGVRLATYASRCIENEVLMHFRGSRKSAGDLSLSDSIDTDSDGNSLSLIDVLADEEDMSERVVQTDLCQHLSQLIDNVLDEREAEILVYLARGRTKAYIADALFVTENTVRSHVRNIYSKLDVHTRQELLDLLER